MLINPNLYRCWLGFISFGFLFWLLSESTSWYIIKASRTLDFIFWPFYGTIREKNMYSMKKKTEIVLFIPPDASNVDLILSSIVEKLILLFGLKLNYVKNDIQVYFIKPIFLEYLWFFQYSFLDVMLFLEDICMYQNFIFCFVFGYTLALYRPSNFCYHPILPGDTWFKPHIRKSA